MKKKLIFAQTEQFRNQLEIQQLRSKNHFVLGIVFLLMLLFSAYVYLVGLSFLDALPFLIGFSSVLLFNIATSAYGRETESFFHINKYITSMGLFSLSISMILYFQSPVMMITLFIVYAITMFFQDLKVLFVSDFLLLFGGLATIFIYPSYLGLAGAPLDSLLGISFFFIMFVLILSVANYIIIKQKSFFFNQIVSSNEIEYRNLDLLIDLKGQTKEETTSVDDYFSALEEFFAAFSEKMEVKNVFKEKLQMMKWIAKGLSFERWVKKYPNMEKEDYERLDSLLTFGHNQLRKAALKLSYSYDIDVQKREIFSETQFKSFNHQSDPFEIKIVAFVLFYTALKKGYGILPGLKEDQIYHSLLDTDFYYYIDSRIIKIYQNNHEVFDTIVTDAFKKKVTK